MEAFDLLGCIPWLWNGDLQRIASSLRASEKERVYIRRKHSKKDKKKAQQGHCFQGLGWIKVRFGYFSCLSFVVLAQGKGFRFMLGYMETVLQRVVFARQRRNCLHDFEATVRPGEVRDDGNC
jgi:hypothetical protein